MINWYVDEGLEVLGDTWKREHPGAVVYYVGDASHASRDSEHNPEPAGSLPGADYGEVDAADFMIGKGGVTRAELAKLAEDLRTGRDPRILYVIWDGRIFSSYAVAGIPAWTWRKYTGKDQHTDHVHVSVNDLFDDNESEWRLGGVRTLTYEDGNISMPILKPGDEDAVLPGYNLIGRAQVLANMLDNSIADVDVDGILGPVTLRKIGVALKMSSAPKQINLPVWRGLMGLKG